jgi:phospholipase C
MRNATRNAGLFAFGALAVAALAVGAVPAQPSTASASGHATLQTTTPIKHVVVLFQENNSFDEVLGKWCSQTARCDGATTGKIHTGATISLSTAPDIVPRATHTVGAQRKAIDGGKMDGFDTNSSCGATKNYKCYTQYSPSAIPNLVALANSYVVSDRTFEDNGTASFGAHVSIVAGTQDFFTGDHPVGHGNGWGCDSGLDAPWYNDPAHMDAQHVIMVPACVPKPDGTGPYRASPVQYTPTIMDAFQNAGLSWSIDAGTRAWEVCPTFANCLYNAAEDQHLKGADQILNDAQHGTLPAFSLVIPAVDQSQHNNRSMMAGDNWIGQVVSALQASSQWSSTAVFITYDDCGCFYDHVAPPTSNGHQLGIRVPMVIVSPYTKVGYTDSTNAQFASILTFVEHNWQLPPLSATGDDNVAYDYSNSFDFAAPPHLARTALRQHALPTSSMSWLKAHPVVPGDPDDDT